MKTNQIAKKIKELRKEAKLTQRELAKFLYVSPNTISRWENGDGKILVPYVYRIARFFHVRGDYLAGLTDEKSPRK